MGAVRRIGAVSHAVPGTVGSPTIAPMSAGIRRLLNDRGPMGLSIAAVLLVVAWVSTWRPQIDADAWWHVAYGITILDRGAIPGTERFSWLTEGSPLFLHSWLWEALIGTADRLGGPTGMSILGLPFLALIVALAWFVIGSVARDVAPIPRATLVLVAMLAGLAFWGSRGSTLDVAFVLATVLAVARYLYDGATRPLAALPIIGLLWANLHGSGVPAFAVCLFGALLAIPLGRRLGDWPGRRIEPVAVAAFGGLAATIVNPYGFRLWTYPLDRGVASAFATEIVEWRPPDLGAPELLVFRLLIPVALLVLWRTRGVGVHPFVMLLAAGWTFAALAVARFVPIAAVLLVMGIAPAFSTRPAVADTGARSIDRRLVLIPTAVLAVVVLGIGWSFIAPGAQTAAIAHREPVVAVEALRSAGCPGRLLASYGWGGYVVRYTGRPVGAYGSSPEGAVGEQTAIELVATDPRPWLDSHRVDVVLAHADGPLSHWLDEAEGWEPRYTDPQATIHARSGDASCDPTPPS
jgi:hypothetical protein